MSRAWTLPFVLTASCAAVGPDYVAPATEMPAAWEDELDADIVATTEADLADWWTTFDDDALSALIARAADRNFELAEALARVDEARARRRGAASGHRPFVDGGAGYQRVGSSANSLGLPVAIPDRDIWSASIEAGWELDLFGRIRRNVEAADADLEATVADRNALRVSLLAEVALAYVDVRTFQERLAIAASNIELQENSLGLARLRFDEGVVSNLDPAQAETNLASTLAEVPALRTGLTAALNRLAVLLGERPGALSAELETPAPIPGVPEQVLIGVPAELLRRRPDIRRAERALAAQTARIGVATAELYPQLRLSGQLGYEADELSDLVESDSGIFGIGGGITWNLFDSGSLRANIDVQDALAEQALARYENTVLLALEDVETGLAAYRNEKVRRAALERAVAASLRSVRLSDELYRGGRTDFQTVLDAQRSLFLLQDLLVVSNAAVTADLIVVYRALGGGWVAEETVGAADD